MSKKEIEPESFEQRDKKYRVVITDITDGEKVISDEIVKGLCLVGEYDDRMLEIVLNENLVGIAAMFSAGSKTKHAVRLATFVESMKRDDASEKAAEMEDMLSEIIKSKGGMQ